MEVRAKKALGQHFLTDQTIARSIVAALLAPSGQSTGDGETGSPEYGEEEAGCGAFARTGLRSNAEQPASSSPEIHRGENWSQSQAEQVLPSDEPCAPTQVLEVGPGMGVLTQYLLQRGDIDLKLVEIDGESVDYLLTHFPGMQGRLYQADFLKLPLERIFPGSFAVIGNFPYNISSQIFFKILDHKDRVPEVVCMIQKEVAERIAEKPGTKTYGILSVLLQAWYDIEYLFTVGSGAFAPPPKVQSAVIRLRRNARAALGCDEALFKTVVKTAFGQRRKTLRNSLKPLIQARLDADPSTGPEAFRADPVFDLRPERLGVEDFVALTRKLTPKP